MLAIVSCVNPFTISLGYFCCMHFIQRRMHGNKYISFIGIVLKTKEIMLILIYVYIHRICQSAQISWNYFKYMSSWWNLQVRLLCKCIQNVYGVMSSVHLLGSHQAKGTSNLHCKIKYVTFSKYWASTFWPCKHWFFSAFEFISKLLFEHGSEFEHINSASHSNPDPVLIMTRSFI